MSPLTSRAGGLISGCAPASSPRAAQHACGAGSTRIRAGRTREAGQAELGTKWSPARRRQRIRGGGGRAAQLPGDTERGRKRGRVLEDQRLTTKSMEGSARSGKACRRRIRRRRPPPELEMEGAGRRRFVLFWAVPAAVARRGGRGRPGAAPGDLGVAGESPERRR